MQNKTKGWGKEPALVGECQWNTARLRHKRTIGGVAELTVGALPSPSDQTIESVVEQLKSNSLRSAALGLELKRYMRFREYPS